MNNILGFVTVSCSRLIEPFLNFHILGFVSCSWLSWLLVLIGFLLFLVFALGGAIYLLSKGYFEISRANINLPKIGGFELVRNKDKEKQLLKELIQKQNQEIQARKEELKRTKRDYLHFSLVMAFYLVIFIVIYQFDRLREKNKKIDGSKPI